MSAEARISKELGDFLESGLAIVMATRAGELQPDGAVAWAAQVQDDRKRLTVCLHAAAAREMLRNLKSHPEIAIDFDQPTTHRACQVKGTYLSSRRAKAAERALVDRQVEGFAKDLEGIGIPRKVAEGWKTWPCLALELRVTHLFEQTPGPGTGGPLK